MKNFLDLRKKVAPTVVVVEKVIMARRSLMTDIMRTVVVILVVSAIGWSLSYADNLLPSAKPQTSSLSVLGVVSQIEGNNIFLDDVQLSNGAKNTVFTFDVDTVTRIETKGYVPLQVSDIFVGDKIIVQGMLEGDLFIAKRVISFSAEAPLLPLVAATSTATTTDSLVATSTLDMASSTFEAETATTTLGGEEPVQEASSSEEVATSTPTIVEKAVDVVTDIVNAVVDAVTPEPELEEEEPLPQEEEAPPAPPIEATPEPEPTPKQESPPAEVPTI